MTVTKEMILREVAGEYILIPTGFMALKIHGMINLSESGCFLWQQLQEECSEDQLVEALLAEYEVDKETASKDVAEFVEQMRQAGVLLD